jgi:nucleoside-diphosphate-sugar epimerase
MLKFRTKNQKVIFFNTNSGYGSSSRDKFCTEETPMNPISLYGILKVEAERSILEAGNAVSLRLATVFGSSPRHRTDLLVNTMVYEYATKKYTVLFEANAMRNYIHILDVVDAFIFSLKNWDRMKDNVYNVGNDALNCSKLDLCNKIKEIFPDFYFVESEIGEDLDKRDYIVSSKKIYNKGFRCKRSLEDGIKELYKSYQIIRENRYSNI